MYSVYVDESGCYGYRYSKLKKFEDLESAENFVANAHADLSDVWRLVHRNGCLSADSINTRTIETYENTVNGNTRAFVYSIVED